MKFVEENFIIWADFASHNTFIYKFTKMTLSIDVNPNRTAEEKRKSTF